MPPRRNVLIFHAGALGDFVLTWPLALALARLYPQSRVWYVTHAGKGVLAERALRLESSDLESGWHALFAGTAPPERPLALLERTHTLVSFLSDGADVWAATAARLAPHANRIYLRSRPNGESAEPIWQYYLRQLQGVPTVAAAAEQMLRVVEARGIGYSHSMVGRIIIHPGSGARNKCWPVGHFAELASRFQSAGRAVCVLLGEVERERFSADELRLLGAFDVKHSADYVELLDELAVARLVIANDSGPAHLAGILGRPTLTLFGPTDARVWKPLGPAVHVLHAADLRALSVERVVEAAQDILARS